MPLFKISTKSTKIVQAENLEEAKELAEDGFTIYEEEEEVEAAEEIDSYVTDFGVIYAND